MSNLHVQPHSDRTEISRESTGLDQSASMGLQKQEDDCEMKPHCLSVNQASEPNHSKSLNGVIEVADNGSMNRLITDGRYLYKQRMGLLSFPMFDVHQNGCKSRNKESGQCSEFNGVASILGCQFVESGTASASTGCKFLPKETIPNLLLELRAGGSVEGGCVPTVRPSGGMPRGYPCGIMNETEKVIPFATASRVHLSHRSSYYDISRETMRISSTLDPSEDIHLGLPMYAKTTRHYLVRNANALDDSDEDRIFGESMLSTKFNGNLGGLLTLSSASGHVRPGLKLQLLDGSTDSEQKDRGTDETQNDYDSQSIERLVTVAGLKNETSAETCQKVDDSLENNHTYDITAFRPNKDALRGKSTASSQAKLSNTASSQAKLSNTALPDMNGKAPAQDGSTDKGETCTKRTQSLNMEYMLSQADYPSSSKSIPGHFIHPRPELGSLWVKRVKLSGTKFVPLGTQSSSVKEASSYGKLRKPSCNILNNHFCLKSSELTTGAHLKHISDSRKRTRSLDMECILSQCDYPSSSNSVPHHVIHPYLELSSRWVTRIKLSGTRSVALGTKSSIIEEASSFVKLRKLCSNLLKSSAGLKSSEPTAGTHLRHASDSKKMAEVPSLSNGWIASNYSLKAGRDALLSHPWIQRWRHDPPISPQKQPASSEPHSPRTNYDHFPKKTFPSIAAMALMGKARNAHQPCQFTHRGSSIVWNSTSLPKD